MQYSSSEAPHDQYQTRYDVGESERLRMSDASVVGGSLSQPPEENDFLIVGLGGSAGSIPSFREFFRHVPPDSGMAFVVILHLSPDYDSHLAELLQGSATVPVTQVQERVKVEPNHVYVIPPNKSLAMRDGSIDPSDILGFEERRAPVDMFFRTLADTHESRAVCVVLSGSGSDGSMGLRRVKEYNGLALVQEPAEAEFGEMPRNSIATGLADFIVPVSDMPRRIMAYRDQLRRAPRAIDDRSDQDERALIDIFTHLRVRTGHDFTNYKRATVLRRIERRLAVRQILRLPEYAEFLRDTPAEGEALLRELLISVTNFFRDPPVWEKLEKIIIPKLLEGKTGDYHLRAWVAGCATGEEAYSLAMLFAEATSHLPSVPDIQVFATDLDVDAVVKARGGFYTLAETADVSPERLRRFFVKEQDGYRVLRELRELVLFAHHNLLKDPPFSHLNFVSCRNLLIYLNRTAQEHAMEVLHFALDPGGYLLLGTAESVEGSSQLFSVIDKEARIFQSRAVPRVVQIMPPAPLTVTADLRHSATGGLEQRGESRGPRLAPLDLHQRLLEEYAPPSVIVDDHQNILHLSERAGRYLQFPAGEASLNLLQVVRPELRIDLRTALYQAAQSRSMVGVRGLVVHTGDRSETINVVVRPVFRESDPAHGFFLVLFEEAREPVEISSRVASASEPAARQLEEELIRVKSQMRVTIEQYEIQTEEAKAANEELQAINEELRSTAEELETSQEELQSVNEELQTVNQELKVKIDEISHANDDMRNLMSSTEIDTIFVDRALRVKLFTPRVHDIFNLIPSDVGRPLLDITSKVTIGELGNDLERVVARLQTIEREVATRDGRWHLMRLLPYRTAEDRIEGVVITFLDITERRRTEEALLQSREELERRVEERTRELREATGMLQAIIDSSPLAIIVADRDRTVTTWNASAERMLSVRADLVIGKPLDDVAPAVVEAMFGDGQSPREAQVRRADGALLNVSVFPAPLRGADGSIHAIMGLLQDVTDPKRLEQERERLLRRIVSSQEEERQRIARELHDQLGQHLTALKVGLEALQPAGESVQRMKGIVGQLDQSIDRLTRELRPPGLDDLGLHGAIGSLIQQFTEASGIHADVHASGTDGERLPEPVETTLYRVLQEALTNIWKHSAAKDISVIIERTPEQVQLIVEDNGSGFEESQLDDDGSGAHFGLLGMRERVSLIGGTFSIESGHGRGTTLYVRVPLARR
jgi:two-component system, chemotaxis family, CheB/CheR fusion protein